MINQTKKDNDEKQGKFIMKQRWTKEKLHRDMLSQGSRRFTMAKMKIRGKFIHRMYNLWQ